MYAGPFNNAPKSSSFDNNQNRQQVGFQNATHQHSNAYSGEQQPQYAPVNNQHAQQASSGQASASQPHDMNGEADRDYTMFPVYSKRAALQFKLSQTRKSQGRNFSFDTVMIEGAIRINPNDNNDKRYDWNKKLSVQVMLSELPIVIAVFLGLAPSCQFMNHGQNKDKGFNFERQEDGLFASVFHKGGSMAVKMDWPTTLNIGHFMLAQYAANFAGLGTDIIMRNINRMCQDMVASNTFPLKNPPRK